ncbi:hypothetical protein V1508DRAFT_50349 [Lipomyces doorenjongii]|uniref:uncharacterized protein n=1 Tax=Lipomyces doorenjongii TaxID=383834 RepID=UPI0034CD5814
MSNTDVCRATVAVLSNPDSFANCPAYFADYNVTTNELSVILEEITHPEKSSVANVPLCTLFEEGKRKWQETQRTTCKIDSTQLLTRCWGHIVSSRNPIDMELISATKSNQDGS